MGRVHKKKLAEYAEAAENDDLNKSLEGDDEEKSSIPSNIPAPADVDEKSAAENEEEHEVFEIKLDDSSSDHEKNGGGGRKASKRKNTEKTSKKKSDENSDKDGDSDDEPLNGGSVAKIGRKAGSSTDKKKLPKGGKVTVQRGKGKLTKPAEEIVEEEDEEEYEVKDIVDHKVENGVSYFLIRWKGFKKEDDTWEAEDTLSCPELIEKYKKKQSNSKGTKKDGNVSETAGKKARTGKDVKKDDSSKEWEVEKIIDYAQEKLGRVFRIRWKGFGAKYDTWEPEENLCCDEIIDKFMKRMKTQENVSFKELRVGTKKPKRLVNETLPRTNYHNPIGRKSKRGGTKKRVYYGDSDE